MLTSSVSVRLPSMRFAVVIFILASIQVTATQDFGNISASLPPIITQASEIPGCPTQQQRETALHEVRNAIASSLVPLTCGNGNWSRVAYLNMSDPMQSCPPEWRDRSANGVRVCGQPAGSNTECHSTLYHPDHSYTRVCGRVIGYQFGYPDGFRSSTVDQTYVDGVSITHGSPRSHIWTFAAEGSELFQHCPCEGGARTTPPYVGSNYYCESGYNGGSSPSSVLYTSDPLWDGAGCVSEGSCCSTAPWFTVDLVSSTSDDIEVRICSDSTDIEEDTPIHLLELYIQ